MVHVTEQEGYIPLPYRIRDMFCYPALYHFKMNFVFCSYSLLLGHLYVARFIQNTFELSPL